MGWGGMDDGWHAMAWDGMLVCSWGFQGSVLEGVFCFFSAGALLLFCFSLFFLSFEKRASCS